MKNDDLFSAMSDIDDVYIEEARPSKRASSRMRWIRFGALAATFAIIIGALGAWLLIPFNTDPSAAIRQYTDSEYYPLIERLNAASFRAPRYKNNLEMLFDSFRDLEGSGSSQAPTQGGNLNFGASNESAEDVTSGAGKYEETTDNQVAGVIEADLIKRTSTHFFYYNAHQNEILVYSIAGEESALVSSYRPQKPDGAQEVYRGKSEFYLTTDGEQLLIIQSYYHENYGTCYDVVSLDVRSPESICELSRIRVTGNYTSSRLVNGNLLLIGEYVIGGGVKYDKPETFLPLINAGDGFEYPSMDDVIFPETVTTRRYTVINKMDAKTLALSDTLAVLSCSDILYVSDSSLYLTTSAYETQEMDGITARGTVTEIVRISYDAEQFKREGSVKLDGYLKDQYSMDELDGKLRVVTTSNRSTYREYSNELTTDATLYESGTSANLFVVDIESMQSVASVLRFAPRGETVRSVRFDGNAAYVCTAVQITDPVFFFDLSDLSNITYKDTGTITGFSTSLIQLGNGYLLGIGVGSAGSVKVEIYEESETGVVSVDAYEIKDAAYNDAYKSYLIDRQNGFFGFGYTDYGTVDKYSSSVDYYVVLRFNGYELVELVEVELGEGACRRAIYVDGFFYFFGGSDFKVRSLG